MYVILYFIWGIVLGYFINRLPQLINKKRTFILQRYKPSEIITVLPANKKNNKLLQFAAVLLFTVLVYLISGNDQSKAKFVQDTLEYVVSLFQLYRRHVDKVPIHQSHIGRNS